VSDRTVGAALASGASCVEDLAVRCGAGGRCGGCRPELERLIEVHVGPRLAERTAAA
jgi:bacterioferritin-associated ferredoxin